jgi:hypothetical protein
MMWGAALLIVLILLAIVVAESASNYSEPVFQNRAAEDWLRAMISTPLSETSRSNTVWAFEQMGPGGTTFLVDTLDRHVTFFDRFIYRRLPAALQKKFRPPTNPDPLANGACIVLFGLHDPQPERTVSLLVKSLSSAKSRGRLYTAAALQHYVQTYSVDCTPYRAKLIRALNHSDGDDRISIANAMQEAGLNGPEVVAAVSQLRTNVNPVIRKAAEDILRRSQTNRQAGPSVQ